MPDKDEILSFLREQRSVFQTAFYIKRIGLFGSFSRGEATAESDIDLLVELDEDTPDNYAVKKDLAEMVSQRFGRPVQIANMKYLKPFVRESVLKETIFV